MHTCKPRFPAHHGTPCSDSSLYEFPSTSRGLMEAYREGGNCTEEKRRVRRKAVLFFKRFRDDIIGMFCGGREEFKVFFDILNNVDPCINFTHEVDTGEGVEFLDLKISLDDQGYISTDLYRKANVKNQLLLPSSAHPPRTTRNSVYSLGLRIVRNVSDSAKRELRLKELAERLRERQYQETVIEAGLEKARQVKREDALKKVQRKAEVKPPHLIVKYDRRSCPALGSILRDNHQSMVSKDNRMGRVFPRPPRAVFERDKNLKDILTRSKLAPVRNATRHGNQQVRNGVTRCNKGTGRTGCPLCAHITDRPAEVVREVEMPPSGRSEKVQGRLTCKQGGSGGFIYLATCTKSGAGYLGESGRGEPLARFQEHRRSVELGTKTVGRHFDDNNCGSEELKFVPFLAVKEKSPYVRKYLEKLLIAKHSFVESDLGINKNH